MKKGCCKSIVNALKQIQQKKLFGFTLVELLIAVLIIGVLTAVAIPMYQKSVDKSRYATLMPLAKNIKDAQEAFYWGGGTYSQDLGSLDVRVPGNPRGNTATLSDGTTVEISTTDGYGYVKLSKNNLNNNYIVYQDRSANYPGEIHCEALTDNSRAEELCQNLGGQKISGSLTDGYTTYILSGTGAGVSPGLNQEAENGGNGNWQSCDTYPCTKECVRLLSNGYSCTGTYNADGSYSEKICKEDLCLNTSYDENGTKTTRTMCVINSEGICETKRNYTYDENGNTIFSHVCSSVASDGTCTAYRAGYLSGGDYTYDANGNQLSWRECSRWGSDGTCIAYRSGLDDTYDENGNIISHRQCDTYEGTVCTEYNRYRTVDYTYDTNGNKITERTCSSVESDGTCSQYSGGYDYGYDENGRLVSQRRCNGFTDDGSCNYDYNSSFEYEYDANGNQISVRPCTSVDDNGICTTYGTTATKYTYDTNGNQTSKRKCYADTNGNCTWYESGGKDYIYDKSGNKTAELTCKTYGDQSVPCAEYAPHGYNDAIAIHYTYDDNGNEIYQRTCSSYEGATCTAYSKVTKKTYDANGNEVSSRSCTSAAGNVGSDGTCTAYNTAGYDYIYDEEGKQVASRVCYRWSGTECTSWNAWEFPAKS